MLRSFDLIFCLFALRPSLCLRLHLVCCLKRSLARSRASPHIHHHFIQPRINPAVECIESISQSSFAAAPKPEPKQQRLILGAPRTLLARRGSSAAATLAAEATHDVLIRRPSELGLALALPILEQLEVELLDLALDLGLLLLSISNLARMSLSSMLELNYIA